MNAEILIIGGGVIGSSIAYHLARQGRQVLVIERSSVAASPAASWASAGGVRRQGRHPAEAKLAVEAIERWRALEQELAADLRYRRGGNLLLAESDAEAEQLTVFVQQQQAMGFAKSATSTMRIGMKAMQTSLALESLAHGSEKCRTRKEFSVAIG